MAASKQVKQRRLEDARARGQRALERATASQRKIDQARSWEDYRRYSSEQATHRRAVQVQGEAVRVQEEHIATQDIDGPASTLARTGRANRTMTRSAKTKR